MRRIRLQSSFARLPSFRVWFLVPQSVVDVRSLKLDICTQLPTLRGLDIPPKQLILEIDDFELLDECAIDLVRDGDILTIKLRESAVLATLKRKANTEEAARARKRGRLPISSEDSDSASSSSTSDSSSSDSSSNSSSVSSSSDANAEDSKLVPRHKVLIQLNNTNPKSKSIPLSSRGQAATGTVTDASQQHTVPPGMGKASTRSRNKRRKLKRKYGAVQSSTERETLQSTGVNESSPSGSDDVLEPSRQISKQHPLPATVSVVPHASVKKINRSKGFTKAAERAVSRKVVFDSSSAVVPSGHSSTFIPPSEREDLPNNLFVTSVEIAWRTNQPRTSREDASEQVQPDDTQAAQADPCLRHSSDWAAIESAWDKYTTLNASMELLPGAIIAWKAFGLDPITLTPQASMLYLGKIVLVDVENVHVQPLQRPDSEHATFGRASMGEDQEPSEQISRPLHEVWSNDWKLIPLIT